MPEPPEPLDRNGHQWVPLYADPTRTERTCHRCALPERSPYAKDECNRMAEIAERSLAPWPGP